MRYGIWMGSVLAAVMVAGCSNKQSTMVGPEAPAVAHAVLHGVEGTRAGSVLLMETDDEVEIVVNARVPLGTTGMHGFHVHEGISCSGEAFADVGDHFSPYPTNEHGAPSESGTHVGDLGNLTSNEAGRIDTRKSIEGLTLSPGKRQITGRTLIIHAGRDDLETQPAGGAGKKILCGVIEPGPMPAL